MTCKLHLLKNRQTFIIQLLIIFLVTGFISFIIHRSLKKQAYIAYHDSLTKLKNRAPFDEQLEQMLISACRKSNYRTVQMLRSA